jgi:hypothetical protein
MSTEPDVKVIVVVSDEHLANIDTVARYLVEAGMTIEYVMGSAGIIAGVVPASKAEGLKEIVGVLETEVSQDLYAI